MLQKTAGPHGQISIEKGTRQRAGMCRGEQQETWVSWESILRKEGMQKRG